MISKSNLLDKRSFQIFLTERGWELKDELIPKVTQLLDEATIGIEESKITEIKKILNQMYNNLK